MLFVCELVLFVCVAALRACACRRVLCKGQGRPPPPVGRGHVELETCTDRHVRRVEAAGIFGGGNRRNRRISAQARREAAGQHELERRRSKLEAAG